MGTPRRPRKAYRPRKVDRPATGHAAPWKLELALQPLDGLLDQLLQDGALDVSETGELVYRASRYEAFYEVTALLDTYVEVFSIAAMRDANLPPPVALRTLAEKLRIDTLERADVVAARENLTMLRRHLMCLPLEELRDIVRIAEIRFRLEEGSSLYKD